MTIEKITRKGSDKEHQTVYDLFHFFDLFFFFILKLMRELSVLYKDFEITISYPITIISTRLNLKIFILTYCKKKVLAMSDKQIELLYRSPAEDGSLISLHFSLSLLLHFFSIPLEVSEHLFSVPLETSPSSLFLSS